MMLSALAYGTGTANLACAGGKAGALCIAVPVNPGMVTLEAPNGAQALVLTARVTGQNSATLDGAMDGGARTSEGVGLAVDVSADGEQGDEGN